MAGSFTTVDARVGDKIEPNSARQTTLESVDIQNMLRDLLNAGCTHMAMEVSSHSLMMYRVDTVDFALAIFTRITEDHLDFHGTREAYREAKAKLLHQVGAHRDGVAVLDYDDEYSYSYLANIPVGKRLSYSALGNPKADLRAREVHVNGRGVSFIAETPWGVHNISLKIAGRFNVGNALAALAGACVTQTKTPGNDVDATRIIGAAIDGAIRGLMALPRVQGRMEIVDVGQPFSVIIDYAHAPDALHTVLSELREASTGKLWVVFGSAGERDHRRYDMGRTAAELADELIIANEDPRDEDPLAIMEEVARGARSKTPTSMRIIPDRREAIAFAINHAHPKDTILLAGKGHETSILIANNEKLPWDERAVVETLLRERSHNAM